MWRCNNAVNMCHVTCFGFLGDLVSLFLGSRCASSSRPILMIYTSSDVFLCKDVPFCVLHTQVVDFPHLGHQIPPPKKNILGA